MTNDKPLSADNQYTEKDKRIKQMENLLKEYADAWRYYDRYDGYHGDCRKWHCEPAADLRERTLKTLAVTDKPKGQYDLISQPDALDDLLPMPNPLKRELD